MRLGPEIGKIDLLKIGHHGYVFSSSQKFLNTLSPEVTVATNRRSKMIYPTVKWRLALTDLHFLPQWITMALWRLSQMAAGS